MKEVACPHCGMILPVDHADEAVASAPASPEAAYSIETVAPTTYDDDVRLPQMRVEIAPPAHGDEAHTLAVADASMPTTEGAVVSTTHPIPRDSDSREVEPGSGDEFLGSDPDPILGLLRRTPSPEGSSASLEPASAAPDALSNLGLESAAAASPTTPETPSSPPIQALDDGDEPRGIGMGTVLLASYASAVTLALIWLLATGRARFTAVAPPTIATDSRPDLGAEGKRALPAPEPIADDLLADLGQTIRVGSLEVTPKEIRTGTVFLERVGSDGGRQQRNGGHEALLLKITLKNISRDAALTPLERSFVRKPDRGIPESFIETGRGDRIDPYPLALESEWSIAGQKFPALKPGESMETVVVSDKDAKGRLVDPMTWRFRIRSSSDKTQLVGVRFGEGEIR